MDRNLGRALSDAKDSIDQLVQEFEDLEQENLRLTIALDESLSREEELRNEK